MADSLPVIQVALPRPLRRTFDYAVAPDAPVPAPGVRVRVPFGRTSVVGLVVDVLDSSPHELKTATDVIDDTPLLPADLVGLAQWLVRYYHHPIGDVVKTLMPVSARRGARAAPSDEVAWTPVGNQETADDLLRRAPKQRALFGRLGELGAVADADVTALGIDRQALGALQAKGLVERQVLLPAYRSQTSDIEPTPAQTEAVARIVRSLGRGTTHVLDGVTGSGKTEVYLRVIDEVLRSGRQALVLVPEIALTPQTTARFVERFGGGRRHCTPR